MKHLRFLRRKLLQYMDDGMIGASDFVTAVVHRNEYINLLCALGFRCSAKSSPLPELSKIMLGIVVHMAADVPTYHVPSDKVELLKQIMSDTMCDMGGWMMRKLGKITGKLLSMSLAIPVTRLMSRGLYACMHSNHDGDWDALVLRSPKAVQELRWLLACLDPCNDLGYPIYPTSK